MVHLCLLMVLECLVFGIIFAFSGTNPMYIIEIGEIAPVYVGFRRGIVAASLLGLVGMLLLAKKLMALISSFDEFLTLERLATIGRFSAWTAHQIRNPLSVIRAQAQIMHLRFRDESAVRANSLIIRQTDKMNDLLSLMTCLSEPELLHKQRVEMRSLLSELLDSYIDTYPDIRFRLVDDCSASVFGHPALLEEALKNVLANAVESIDGSGDIFVECKLDKDKIRVEILDSGPGIEKEALESAFDVGFTTKTQGTGLGLPIARSIMSAHGGNVNLSRASKPGFGTLASFTLPTYASVIGHTQLDCAASQTTGEVQTQQIADVT